MAVPTREVEETGSKDMTNPSKSTFILPNIPLPFSLGQYSDYIMQSKENYNQFRTTNAYFKSKHRNPRLC